MDSSHFWNLAIVFISLCELVNVFGDLSQPQCSDSSLVITGGTFSLSKMYNHGSTLIYHCPEGFYPHPVKTRECYSGMWDPPPGRKRQICKKVSCPNPNVLQNGVVIPNKSVYYVNDTTTYTCHSGYTFRGSATRVCQSNGKWNGGTPICSHDSDHCPDPGTPPGARREGRVFDIDYKVIYHCDGNFKLIGSKERVCQDDGQWSGKEPECYTDFTYDTPQEVAEAFGSSLKTTLTMHEDSGQYQKKIRLDQGGKLDIYIALDSSSSISEKDFILSKSIIMQLIEKISYYQVSPNYEIIFFASDVVKLISMDEFKRNKDKELKTIISELENFKFTASRQQSGTNIAKAYGAIVSSISFEKARDPESFRETHHVVIMFTDGVANMGVNPKRKVEELKEIVFDGDVKREKYLDLYVFGIGADVLKQELDQWVTKRDDNDKHLFLLKDPEMIKETLDQMIDESTSVSLCGLYRDYDDGTESSKRLTFPWLIKIAVNNNGTMAYCFGSLVTPKFILTAAHCFRRGVTTANIQIETPSAKGTGLPKLKRFINHPDYNTRRKVDEGIEEYYENDVALIELDTNVVISADLRTICIPCTKETSEALKLSGADVTCQHQRDLLMKGDFVKAFFMSNEKKRIHIKQGQMKDACVEDTKNVLKITEHIARDIITDHFLCSGGVTQNHKDDLSCKGDSGGASFVEQKYRVIQIGVISWGLKDVCGNENDEKARDFHINLFSPKVQTFLKKYLGDGKIGAPLNFI